MDGIKSNPVINTSKPPSSDEIIPISDFSVRLLQKCIDNEENVLISPLSVISALAMTANGADSETLAQMEEVLGLSTEELNKYLYVYMVSLPEDDKCKLSLANSIWFKDTKSLTVNPEFLQANADYYNAGIYKTPFDHSTLKDINNWVNTNTDGMIDEILDEIPQDAIMYLVNALAFDAEWANIYEKTQVRNDTFTTEDGETETVKLMFSREYAYLEDLNACGFLKYYKNHNYAFAALLPDENITVADYLSTLTGEKLAGLLANASDVPVNAAIPKFECEYDIEMSDVLKDLGMTNAFNSSLADFSRLGHSTEGNIYIGRVLHKTFIGVNEKGTLAGAATAVEMKTESAMMEPEEIKTVYLNRPFIYMLIDCESKLPLFIGTTMEIED